MSENTITIPADLWDHWNPDELRGAADTALRDGERRVTARLLRRLADEIERQAPREPGWYSVRYDDFGGAASERSLYHWHDNDWWIDAADSMRVKIGTSAMIEGPFTIGRADS